MFTLNCNGRLLVVDKPLVMGILNITPDSFYGGSRLMDEAAQIKKAEEMIFQGASILDIGAQSTRPGSSRINEEEELRRAIPAIEAIHKHFPHTIISIDTYSANVARAAVEAGALIVNDISAGEMDADMLSVVARGKVPYICMHMRGTPETMQQFASYENVAKEVLEYFLQRLELCKAAGINDVIIDPGFGFAKNSQHNFQLLKDLSVLQLLNKPILAGLSRKSTIYKTLGTDAEQALNGTTVVNTIALLNGASILRVHDVKEASEAIKLVQAYKDASHSP